MPEQDFNFWREFFDGGWFEFCLEVGPDLIVLVLQCLLHW